MKKFDKAAAMREARVCTREGEEVRILCYDLKHRLYPIVAAITEGDGTEWIRRYTIKGEFTCGEDGKDDLMMADDDYMEKLERGEYNTHEQRVPECQMPHRFLTIRDIAEKFPASSPTDESYWRKMYAGMAMQGLCAANGTMKPASMVADVAVEYADALVEKLKKEREK